MGNNSVNLKNINRVSDFDFTLQTGACVQIGVIIFLCVIEMQI